MVELYAGMEMSMDDIKKMLSYAHFLSDDRNTSPSDIDCSAVGKYYAQSKH